MVLLLGIRAEDGDYRVGVGSDHKSAHNEPSLLGSHQEGRDLPIDLRLPSPQAGLRGATGIRLARLPGDNLREPGQEFSGGIPHLCGADLEQRALGLRYTCLLHSAVPGREYRALLCGELLHLTGSWPEESAPGAVVHEGGDGGDGVCDHGGFRVLSSVRCCLDEVFLTEGETR